MAQIFRKLWLLLDRGDRRRAIRLLTMMVVAAVLEVVAVGLIPGYLALLTRPRAIMRNHTVAQITNAVGIHHVDQFLIVAALLILVIFLCKDAYNILVEYRKASFATDLQAKLADSLLASYLHAPYPWHLRHNSADLIRNTNTAVPQLGGFVVMPILVVITEMLVVTAVLLLLLVLEPVTAIAVLAVLGITSASFYRAVQARTARLGAMQFEYRARMIQIVNEGLGGLKETRVLGGENHFLRAFRQSVNRVVRDHLDVDHIGSEKRELNVTEFGPIHHVCVQVQSELPDNVVNVLRGGLGVPAVVEVDRERPQAERHSFVGQVRTVGSTAEADDAVVLLAATGFLDLGYSGFDGSACP